MELEEQQHKLYTILDNKIELERIQSVLRNKCDDMKAFAEVLEIMQENRITEIIKEQHPVVQLKSTLGAILIKQLREIDKEYLEVIELAKNSI